MKMFRGRLLRAFLRKWSKLRSEVLASANYDYSQWSLLTWTQEEEAIPKDVPKGHMVVYVGDECKRFVIRVAFLGHPLFRTLLDQAQEVYEFNHGSKLCLPCNENIFLGILQCIGAQQDRKIWLCF